MAERFGAWLRGGWAKLRGTTWAERAAVLLAAALVVWAIVTGGAELRRQGRARECLAEIKAAKLAAGAVAAQYYGSGRAFADQTTADGFADGVAEEIEELGSLPGQVFLLQISENGYTVEKLLYQEDDFYALYDAENGYTVYRAEERQRFAGAG